MIKPKKYRLFIFVIIILIVLSLAGGGLAWAAQTYGAERDLVLGAIGRVYTGTLSSGRYTAGVDMPAGEYTLSVTRGTGSFTIYKAEGDPEETVVEEEADPVYTKMLEEGDVLALYGLEVDLRCGSTRSAVEEREADPSLDFDTPVSLSAGDGTQAVSYTAGQDFPAGTYTLRAVLNRGTVTVGDVTLTMDSDITDDDGEKADTGTDGATRFFLHLPLAEGDVLTLEGVSVQLYPD